MTFPNSSVGTTVTYGFVSAENVRSVQMTEGAINTVDISVFMDQWPAVATGRRMPREVVVKTLDIPEDESWGRWEVDNYDPRNLGFPILDIRPSSVSSSSPASFSHQAYLVSASVGMAVDAVVEFTWVFRTAF